MFHAPILHQRRNQQYHHQPRHQTNRAKPQPRTNPINTSVAGFNNGSPSRMPAPRPSIPVGDAFPPDRSRTAGTHHTRQRKQRSQRVPRKRDCPSVRSNQSRGISPESTNRGSPPAPPLSIPRGKDHRVIQRRLPRISICLRKDNLPILWVSAAVNALP